MAKPSGSLKRRLILLVITILVLAYLGPCLERAVTLDGITGATKKAKAKEK